MKVTVIGGGSTYTPELVHGFLARAKTFPLRELYLMDTDAQRLEIVGGLVRRIVEAWDRPFQVICTTDLHEAVQDTRYVISQLRVGLMPARRADEYLCARHGLIGQETTGIGGMAKALRTIPALLDVADEMMRSAPEAFLVNFTNPAGLITEALQTYRPALRTIGVCNVPITAKMMILQGLREERGLEIDPAEAELDTLGLNHLSWHRGFRVKGEDIWPEVFQTYLQQNAQHQEWDPDLLQALGMIPNYYLQYYYHTAKKLAQQQTWPPSRAEEVMEVESKLLDLYRDPALHDVPELLMQRGGAYYSTMATQLLNAIENDSAEIHVVNTRHAGAVPGWPEDWVVELPCVIDRNGVHPLPTQPLPEVCQGLVTAVKSYEQLTALAAVQGDRQALYQAMLAHPLGPQAEDIPGVLDDLLAVHRAFLPQF